MKPGVTWGLASSGCWSCGTSLKGSDDQADTSPASLPPATARMLQLTRSRAAYVCGTVTRYAQPLLAKLHSCLTLDQGTSVGARPL